MRFDRLISIIIPVYNVEKYLSKCLDSILAQTYTNLEIILVDDGSTDNSGKICDEYAKRYKRIKVLRQKNYGVSYARNMGLKVAKGYFVSFMDSDDMLYTDTYLQSIKVIQQYNVELVKWKFSSHKPLNAFLGKDVKLLAKNMSKLCMENILDNSVSNCLFRKDIITNNKIIFNSGIKQGEDLLFLINYLSYVKKCYLINRVYYRYTQRYDSATKNYNSNYINDIEALINMLNDFTNHKKYLRHSFYNRTVLLAFYVLLMEVKSKEQIKIKLANIKYFFNHIDSFLNKANYKNISLCKQLVVYLASKNYIFTSYILTEIMSFVYSLQQRLLNKLSRNI